MTTFTINTKRVREDDARFSLPEGALLQQVTRYNDRTFEVIWLEEEAEDGD